MMVSTVMQFVCQHEKFRVEQELVNAEPVTCSKASDQTKRSAGISLVD